MTKITTLFVDIGGVLLTNGWDHIARKKTAQHFGLDFKEMENRHRMTLDAYESGKLSLREYLDFVVFYEKREFSTTQFRQYMRYQSKPYGRMIELIRELKTQYNLKIVALSNEAREINTYRIRKFNLESFVDFFISSCFVHLRKPDPDIFQMALDISQTPLNEIIYIEDRPLFVEAAKNCGIRGICHKNVESTAQALAYFGLERGKTE